MMESITKIMDGLECCAARDCYSCPYHDVEDIDLNYDACMIALHQDARDALKAMELSRPNMPRVLSRQDVETLGKQVPLCVEERVPVGVWKYSILKWLGAEFVREAYIVDGSCYYNAETYGRTWRAWTNWPDEEMRKAVEWDE